MKRDTDAEMEQAIERLLLIARQTQVTQDVEKLVDNSREMSDLVLWVVPKLSQGITELAGVIADMFLHGRKA